MEIEEFSNKIKESFEKIDISLNEEQIKQYYEYMNLLIDWNKKINLTAIIEPSDIILKHFVDSATILKYIKDNESIVDVGTGAGFPGIPIKIANSTLNITLLDSLNKRINFLNEVIQENNLEKIETVHSRVEDFGNNLKYREKFDVATSRAVANLSVLAEYMLPLVKVGGRCICMKGSEIDEELEKSKNAINILGGKIVKVEQFKLIDSDNTRNIVIIEKVKKTPNKYPRKAGMPAKQPL